MPVTPDLPVRQLAYFVPDIEAAAREHSRAFGSGPFFTFNHVPLTQSMHRGVERPFDHSSAYGQWGDVMVEFVQQHNPDPSACHDLYPVGSGHFGLHHTAVWVDDLHVAIARFESAGMPLAQISTTAFGTEFAFVDASQSLGHMIELYEGNEGLRSFYAMVRDAAQGWDGSNVIRLLEEQE
jgi:catechol 2,3-dioxygenase-like lactoylglutathione lyase family enzyme